MVENAQSVLEAADTARQLFQDKDNSRFWPGPLVRRLESAGPRLWGSRVGYVSRPNTHPTLNKFPIDYIRLFRPT